MIKRVQLLKGALAFVVVILTGQLIQRISWKHLIELTCHFRQQQGLQLHHHSWILPAV